MDSFFYFAYGSNMLRERLRARCKSASVLGVAVASGYSIIFGKRSDDGSGKATIVKSDVNRSSVYGVLFEIKGTELSELDKFERCGNGYDRNDSFDVELIVDGKQLQVTTYIASLDYVDSTLKPYDWYKALVLAGALQNALNSTYIKNLRAIPVIKDKKECRKRRIEALDVLNKAGYPDYKQI